MNEINDLAYAIAAYRSNDSDDNLGKLYDELANNIFTVPVIITPKPMRDENGEVQITRNSKVNFHIMKNNANQRYYLVFSCVEEFNDWRKDQQLDSIELTFFDLVKLLLKDPSISGILVDPLNGNMTFDKDLIYSINDVCEFEDTQED